MVEGAENVQPGGGSPPTDAIGRVIDAAFAIAPIRGWSRVSLTEIAQAAGMSLAELRAVVSCKAEILRLFIERIDRAMVAEPPAQGTARDRLFDVIMRRFDALSAHKQGLAAVLGDVASDPTIGASLLPGFWRSLAWMLEAAGLGTGGIRGVLRRKGLAVIYANAFRVWLDDSSPDMEKTMAAVDRGLQQAERLLRLCRFGGEPAEPPVATEPPPTV